MNVYTTWLFNQIERKKKTYENNILLYTKTEPVFFSICVQISLLRNKFTEFGLTWFRNQLIHSYQLIYISSLWTPRK